MKNPNTHKRFNLTISQYLELFKIQISLTSYLKLEEIRFNKNTSTKLKGTIWTELLETQEFKCYYCGTDIRMLQQLILASVIRPRKRGVYGYSGMHFELDHRNANNLDNSKSNIVASCYFCNNDKSNTINCEVFKEYFGTVKGQAFESLFKTNNLTFSKNFRHHLVSDYDITN
jgi:hypothetical protein